MLERLKEAVRNRKRDMLRQYVLSVPSVDRLVNEGLLFVDIRTPYVILSVGLHMALMDDESMLAKRRYRLLKKMGLIKRDSRYVAFMDTVLAYINFKRGRMKKTLPFLGKGTTLGFTVSGRKEPVLLAGFYRDGVIDYDVPKQELSR